LDLRFISGVSQEKAGAIHPSALERVGIIERDFGSRMITD
jgi:hypothetical protein